MAHEIKDGAGTGAKLKVDYKNRAHVHAVTTSEQSNATNSGEAYNINTGTITLTNATDTPVLYFKNNESREVVIETIAVGIGPSTGGVSTEIPEITLVANPTAGTTIDNANDVDMNVNRNIGSNLNLTALAYKGATGETITDGTDAALFYQATGGRLAAPVTLVLPTGASIAIKVKAPTSNTSMNVYAALILYIKEQEYEDS